MKVICFGSSSTGGVVVFPYADTTELALRLRDAPYLAKPRSLVLLKSGEVFLVLRVSGARYETSQNYVSSAFRDILRVLDRNKLFFIYWYKVVLSSNIKTIWVPDIVISSYLTGGLLGRILVFLL